MVDALITYGGDRVGYSAMRSLAGLGLKVAVADPSRIGLSQLSRFCGRNYLLGQPHTAAEAFVNNVKRILEDCRAHFVLPSQSDTEVLAKYRRLLPDSVILPLDSYEKIRMANDKKQMATYASSIGIDVPDVIEWKTLDELEGKLNDVDYKLVVKLRDGYSAKWAFYPEDNAGAFDICKGLVSRYSLGPDRFPMVQRKVYGEGWGVSCLYHEGKKLASFTHHRLRQMPPTGGASTLRVSARNEIMEACAEKLLDSLTWHGIAMVEFKYNPKTKETWFMEINPRLWGSIGLAVVSGVDLVALLYIASTEGPDKALSLARPQREGLITRWWLGDARLAVLEARRLSLSKALRYLMPCGADACDEFKMDDPGAALGAIARPFAKYLV